MLSGHLREYVGSLATGKRNPTRRRRESQITAGFFAVLVLAVAISGWHFREQYREQNRITHAVGVVRQLLNATDP